MDTRATSTRALLPNEPAPPETQGPLRSSQTLLWAIALHPLTQPQVHPHEGVTAQHPAVPTVTLGTDLPKTPSAHLSSPQPELRSLQEMSTGNV